MIEKFVSDEESLDGEDGIASMLGFATNFLNKDSDKKKKSKKKRPDGNIIFDEEIPQPKYQD